MAAKRRELPGALADPQVAGPLGSLALSVVRPRSSTLAMRALKWHTDLTRLGVSMPLFIVHDIGMLLAAPNEQLGLGPRAGSADLLAQAPGGAQLFSQYRGLIDEIAESEAALRSHALSMSDDLVVIVIARLLGSVSARCRTEPAYLSSVPLDASLFERLDPELPRLFNSLNRQFELEALSELLRARLYVLTVVDALDLDTLQLFGMLGGDASAGAMAQVDLFRVLGSPEANDVVNFSLEILPSVLEAKVRPGVGTVAAFGYSGLSRKGSIDSMVLTELTWDESEFMRRLADDEVLYYARETTHDEAQRIHYILIDASASMRGERATFARGMAIAAAKKLLLEGEDVVFRFFDSRLYEPHAAHSGKLPIAYLLSFKGERGRNPARVFSELLTALELSQHRDPREPIVHVFTHAALYIPRETVDEITRRADVSAVFMLPSGGKLDLDYLDLLDAYWVVDHESLASRDDRADLARDILDDVGAKDTAPTSSKLGAAPRPNDAAP